MFCQHMQTCRAPMRASTRTSGMAIFSVRILLLLSRVFFFSLSLSSLLFCCWRFFSLFSFLFSLLLSAFVVCSGARVFPAEAGPGAALGGQ
eukprot:m.179319 g.179319  ORF g.179319 m.179319 type:complete len:91 (-) comp53420_c0_seq3:119-391(-)